MTRNFMACALVNFCFRLLQACNYLRRRWSSIGFRAHCKVVSVGNIAVGGTGKTPFIDLLLDSFPKAAVVTRGYKARLSSPSPTLLVGEAFPSQACYGDEAYLLHVKHPSALISICTKKRRALELVHKKVQLAILDDGFQHFQIARDIDVVVVHGEKPFERLRESRRALRYADYIVINYSTLEAIELVRLVSTAPLICCRPKITHFYSSVNSVKVAKPEKVVALSGIGSPENFQKSLEMEGVKVVSSIALPDHADIAPHRVAELRGLSPIVITEKDWARNPKLQYADLIVAAMKLEIMEGEQHFTRLIKELS